MEHGYTHPVHSGSESAGGLLSNIDAVDDTAQIGRAWDRKLRCSVFQWKAVIIRMCASTAGTGSVFAA